MNNITVLKFGGSVLIDDGAVKNAAEIIKKEYEKGKAVIAVVSAQGGMTDALLSEALRLSDKPSKRELDVIMSAGELLSSSKLAIAVGNIGIKSVSLSGFQAGIMTSSANGEARIKDIDTARLKKEISERKIFSKSETSSLTTVPSASEKAERTSKTTEYLRASSTARGLSTLTPRKDSSCMLL